MNDICMELRDISRREKASGISGCCLDAANEIEHLRAENEALREALECIAGGEIYPREVAREALEAKGE